MMLVLNDVATLSYNHPQTISNNVATDLWVTELIYMIVLKDLKCFLIKEDFWLSKQYNPIRYCNLLKIVKTCA